MDKNPKNYLLSTRDSLSFKTIWTETGAFHPIVAEYTLFANTYSNILQDILYIRQKTSFNEFRKIEIVSGILSDHNSMKLKLNWRQKLENLQIGRD